MAELGLMWGPNGNSTEQVANDEDRIIEPESSVAAFRISVDLSEYIQKNASCLLWIPRPRDTRTVRWLARRLRRIAALRDRFCLLCDSHLLPPDEPLQLLQPGDALRVVRVTHEWQRVFSFRGERAPPVPPPKAKKRHKTNTVEAEPPTLSPVTQSKPTQELVVPKTKSFSPPEPLQPFSLPTTSQSVLPSPVQPTLPNDFVSKTKPLPPPEPLLPFSLPTTSPSVLTPPIQPTSSIPVTRPPSQDEELQRVKRRALALLKKVEVDFKQDSERDGGEDETDAGNEWPPAKKRRRRVRRRRALPPIDFEQELMLGLMESANSVPQATPEPSPAITMTPVTTVSKPHSISSPCLSTQPTLESLANPTLPTHPILAPPVPMASLFASPPGPVVLRGETTPRLPRLIRALDATRNEEIGQVSQELSASTTPAPLSQTAVHCI